ncbi:MAG: hypothetical protein ACHREM_23535 [Polyangiales bacterium]
MNQCTLATAHTRSGGRLLIAATFAIATVTTVVTRVPAQERTQPVAMLVKLRSGVTLQGELVENAPGDHVTIRLATGEIRTIPAADIVATPDVKVPAVTITTVTVGDTTTDVHATADGASVHVETRASGPSTASGGATDDSQVGRTLFVDARPLVPLPLRSTWTPPIEHSHVEPDTRTAAWIVTLSGAAAGVAGLYLVTQGNSAPDEFGGKQIAEIFLLSSALPFIIAGLCLFPSSSPPSSRLSTPPSVAHGGGLFIGPSGIAF